MSEYTEHTIKKIRILIRLAGLLEQEKLITPDERLKLLRLIKRESSL